MPGKQDGPGPIIYGPPRAPQIAKMHNFVYCGPYMKNWQLFFSLVIHIFSYFGFKLKNFLSDCFLI